MDICIGTAQFGLDYGINNKDGKLNQHQVNDVLTYAYENGIVNIDTASSYGDSEQKIGTYLQNCQQKFRVITKLKPGVRNLNDIQKNIVESRSKLAGKNIYGLLIHDFSDYLHNKSIFKMLHNIKGRYHIDNIGVSLYYPHELELLLQAEEKIEIVQVPFNILDRRFSPMFQELKSRKIKIFSRSVFLQGVFFLPPKDLPPYLKLFRPLLEWLAMYEKSYGLYAGQLAFQYVYRNKIIDSMIIGVDNKSHLSVHVESLNKCPPKKVFDNIDGFIADLAIPNKLLVPTNWSDHG